jgi:hypothetical protein
MLIGGLKLQITHEWLEIGANVNRPITMSHGEATDGIFFSIRDIP